MERHVERVSTNNGNDSGATSESPSTRALVSEIGGRLLQLAQAEVELARSELASDGRAGRRTIVGLAMAVALGLAGFTLLLVAVALALVPLLPGWLAALVVAAAVLGTSVTVGCLAWRQRPRSPLALTRKSLKEDWEWLKEQVA